MHNDKKTVEWTSWFPWNGCVIAKVTQRCSCWLLPTEINRYKFGLSCGSSLCSDSSNAERRHSPSRPQKGADSQTKSRVAGKVTFQWLQKEEGEMLIKHRQAFISQFEACAFASYVFPELHFNADSGEMNKNSNCTCPFKSYLSAWAFIFILFHAIIHFLFLIIECIYATLKHPRQQLQCWVMMLAFSLKLLMIGFFISWLGVFLFFGFFSSWGI